MFHMHAGAANRRAVSAGVRTIPARVQHTVLSIDGVGERLYAFVDDIYVYVTSTPQKTLHVLRSAQEALSVRRARFGGEAGQQDLLFAPC